MWASVRTRHRPRFSDSEEKPDKLPLRDSVHTEQGEWDRQPANLRVCFITMT